MLQFYQIDLVSLLNDITLDDEGESEMFKLEMVVKLREREGQKVDLGRSLKGHL